MKISRLLLMGWGIALGLLPAHGQDRRAREAYELSLIHI